MNKVMENNPAGTLIEIDSMLLQEALALSNSPTPTELLEAALQEYIQRRRQLKVVELFGTIDYDQEYNYKQQRQI
ncbi:type II toxin-antitoxin system VapB family antitoxin [Roseofilum sp. Guam]|uniref:type II toxin-antitoxin system VapB family antitoxin n=1 Tax=Roseofilum sp. Guam TaxID=2821502 RepID=UPI00298E2C78|nr:type II toxin-antitoxin system VapB family antitoxin [Roseofilum sp. Guam]